MVFYQLPLVYDKMHVYIYFLQSLSLSEPFKEMANEGMRRTIIFNSRVCNDVDLEVGNCIRIHPPWYDNEV